MSTAGATDESRSRTAAARREKMRRRLIETVIFLVAPHGQDRVMVDDVIREAEVSRGTFYRYFRTVPELMEAAKLTLSEEMVAMVREAGEPDGDPAHSIAVQALRFLDAFERYPLVGQFSVKIAMQWLGPDSLLHRTAPTPLTRGMESGRFRPMPIDLALDMLQLGLVAILARWIELTGEARAESVAALLRMLGVPGDEAEALARVGFSPVFAPEGSLIALSHALHRAAGQDARAGAAAVT